MESPKFVCSVCSHHIKIAKDYAELNAVLLEKNKRFSARLRELRVRFEKIKILVAESSDFADPN